MILLMWDGGAGQRQDPDLPSLPTWLHLQACFEIVVAVFMTQILLDFLRPNFRHPHIGRFEDVFILSL